MEIQSCFFINECSTTVPEHFGFQHFAEMWPTQLKIMLITHISFWLHMQTEQPYPSSLFQFAA